MAITREDRAEAKRDERLERKREDKAESKRLYEEMEEKAVDSEAEKISELDLAKEIQVLLANIEYKGTSHIYEQTRAMYIEPAKKKLDLLIKSLS